VIAGLARSMYQSASLTSISFPCLSRRPFPAFFRLAVCVHLIAYLAQGPDLHGFCKDFGPMGNPSTST
jgi:hypothetical protein